jgi:hypothetical protein
MRTRRAKVSDETAAHLALHVLGAASAAAVAHRCGWSLLRAQVALERLEAGGQVLVERRAAEGRLWRRRGVA